MRKQFGAVLLVLGLVLTTACTGATASERARDSGPAAPASALAAAAQQLTVTARDSMKFEPSSVTVKAGQPVEVTLRNEGRMAHDFTLSEGVSRRVKIRADGGASASATFTIDRPGTYTFDCSVADHKAAGMTGTITAQ